MLNLVYQLIYNHRLYQTYENIQQCLTIVLYFFLQYYKTYVVSSLFLAINFTQGRFIVKVRNFSFHQNINKVKSVLDKYGIEWELGNETGWSDNSIIFDGGDSKILVYVDEVEVIAQVRRFVIEP